MLLVLFVLQLCLISQVVQSIENIKLVKSFFLKIFRVLFSIVEFGLLYVLPYRLIVVMFPLCCVVAVCWTVIVVIFWALHIRPHLR